MIKRMQPVMAFLLLASVVFSANAHTQWQWLDNAGRKVYSDMPPPSSVPESRILAQPGRSLELAAPAVKADDPSHAQNAQNPQQQQGQNEVGSAALAPAEASAQAPAEAAAEPPTPEQIALEKAQAAEQAEIEARNTQVKAANCTAARRNLGQLDSGRSATTTNARGELVFMDEATRKQQRQRVQAVVDANC